MAFYFRLFFFFFFFWPGKLFRFLFFSIKTLNSTFFFFFFLPLLCFFMLDWKYTGNIPVKAFFDWLISYLFLFFSLSFFLTLSLTENQQSRESERIEGNHQLGSTHQPGDTLIIEKIRLNQTGSYTCSVKNAFSKHTKTFQIKVRGKFKLPFFHFSLFFWYFFSTQTFPVKFIFIIKHHFFWLSCVSHVFVALFSLWFLIIDHLKNNFFSFFVSSSSVVFHI